MASRVASAFIVNVLPDGGVNALSGLHRFVLVGLMREAHQAFMI
ncbi:hypothetical protein CIP106467_1662 [Citrobacter europaeus]|nr:hypothetical protein CIP106467_1662 [Citrobacter europaeus]